MSELFRRLRLLPDKLLNADCHAIITARKRLQNRARQLQQGIEPFPASHGDVYRVRAIHVNTRVDNFDAMLASHGIACAPRCWVSAGWAASRVAATGIVGQGLKERPQ